MFIVPEGVTLGLQSYEDAGYVVTPRPPTKSKAPIRVDIPDNPEINDGAAFVANAIEVDFRKDSFNRVENAPVDPPKEVLLRAVNRVLARLRYITRQHAIRPMRQESTNWLVNYFNDDGSELEHKPGLVRSRGGLSRRYVFAGVDADIWSKANSLGVDWQPPPWDDILLDANAALPHVGTMAVLGATALEVFIAYVLDRLAAQTQIPPEVWRWINKRRDWLKNPSTDEQFDILLKLLSGHSLKERPSLWEAFQNLRTARNTFVHGGVAMVGREAITSREAFELLVKANEIVRCVRDWMPAELRWIEFNLTTNVTFDIPIKLPS